MTKPTLVKAIKRAKLQADAGYLNSVERFFRGHLERKRVAYKLSYNLVDRAFQGYDKGYNLRVPLSVKDSTGYLTFGRKDIVRLLKMKLNELSNMKGISMLTIAFFKTDGTTMEVTLVSQTHTVYNHSEIGQVINVLIR